MLVKNSITKAIIKHLTYFANTINSKMYNKSQTDIKISNLNNNINNNYIKKPDLEQKAINRYNTVYTENVIFNSIASSKGTYALLDSIENYNYLIVYMHLYVENSMIRAFRSSLIINVKDNAYCTNSSEPQYRIQVSNKDGFYIDFSFKDNVTLNIHSAISSNNNFTPRIYKIQGIKL